MDIPSREALEAMFEHIRTATNWRVDGPLLWSYFFTSPSKQKLNSVVPLLEEKGYEAIDIFKSEKGSHYVLQVDKEEIHTVESLFDRNEQLCIFAKLHRLRSYSRMEAGPIKTQPSANATLTKIARYKGTQMVPSQKREA
jgi:hypothetical protein